MDKEKLNKQDAEILDKEERRTFKALQELRLHEKLQVDGYTTVMKVPGGLMYETWNSEETGLALCFVPLHSVEEVLQDGSRHLIREPIISKLKSKNDER